MHYVTRTNICTCILINGMWWIHSVFFLKCSRFKSRLNVVIKSHIYVTVSVSYSAINKPSEGFQKGGGGGLPCPIMGAPERRNVCPAWGHQKGEGSAKLEGSRRGGGVVVSSLGASERRERLSEPSLGTTEGRRKLSVTRLRAPEGGKLSMASLGAPEGGERLCQTWGLQKGEGCLWQACLW